MSLRQLAPALVSYGLFVVGVVLSVFTLWLVVLSGQQVPPSVLMTCAGGAFLSFFVGGITRIGDWHHSYGASQLVISKWIRW